MTTPEQSTATSNPNEGVVPLDKPIARGANTIDSLTLRKPASGEL
ncbi:TPA: phage tail assembly protein, partial [Pseudomonas aeruginosa]|nr:phage tail assembly protein [Pseudomonas aeruginosa]